MKTEPIILEASSRHYCGTNIARCNGCTASSTNSASIAVTNAAVKHAAKVYLPDGRRGIPSTWRVDAKEIFDGQWLVTFYPPKPRPAVACAAP